MKRIKKNILYDKIEHYISKGDNFKNLKILIEKFSNEREINKIDIKINQTKFNNVNNLKMALNEKSFYIMKKSFWNKCIPDKKDEKGIEFILNEKQIIIKIKENEELKFKKHEGIISKSNIINEDNLNNNKKKLKHNRNVSKNDLYRSINYICSRNKNCIENNHFSDDDNILYKNKNYEKDLLERKNIKFFHRYQNILRNLKTEETKHYKNKIFNKEDIDKIMKSKNLLEYDKLKYDFAFKIGSLEAINRNPFKRNKKIKTDILKKKKELITNTIENKVNTAINNLDEGKRESKHYNIEDFIKL